uniref:Orf105c n=1 Tax=Batis maritima TaxID=4436 RepID=A0A068BBW8_BATMA|nr:orf105c [Batis maritima]AIC83410.1 orf105c [Batis maritima]
MTSGTTMVNADGRPLQSERNIPTHLSHSFEKIRYRLMNWTIGLEEDEDTRTLLPFTAWGFSSFQRRESHEVDFYAIWQTIGNELRNSSGFLHMAGLLREKGFGRI